LDSYDLLARLRTESFEPQSVDAKESDIKITVGEVLHLFFYNTS
jgi:hypothetical protein